MRRLVCEWNGSPIRGLAVSVLHFGDDVSVEPVTMAQAFFTALKPVLPQSVTITIPPGGDVIDPSTGRLEDVWTAGAGATVQGDVFANNVTGGAGLVINWLTSGIVNGRRVRGRTFVVPIAGGAYDPDGTLTPTALTAAAQASANLDTGGVYVWHRPTTKGGSDGSAHYINASRTNDKVAFLRSRRD